MTDFQFSKLEQLVKENTTRIIRSEFTDLNNKSAWMSRGYNSDRNEYYMIDSHFDPEISKWIEDVPVPLINGKGIPLSLFLDLRAMKLLEIQQGTLNYFVIYHIHDWDTVFNLTNLLKLNPHKKAIDLIQNTRLFQSRSNTIIQSGHIIEDIKIEADEAIFSNPLHLYHEELTEERRSQLCEKYDIDSQDSVFWNFSIVIKVKSRFR